MELIQKEKDTYVKQVSNECIGKYYLIVYFV